MTYYDTLTKKNGKFPVGPGWQKLVKTVIILIKDHHKYNKTTLPLISDIKEKYGGLRISIYGDEYDQGVVDLAESLSSYVCEECGAEGRLRPFGWMKTLCKKHWTENITTDKKKRQEVTREYIKSWGEKPLYPDAELTIGSKNVLTNKEALAFIKKTNNAKMSKKQKAFLEECVTLIKNSEKKRD